MICLKHQQQYSEGQFCVYCGSPYTISITSTWTETEDERKARERREKATTAGRASAKRRWGETVSTEALNN